MLSVRNYAGDRGTQSVSVKLGHFTIIMGVDLAIYTCNYDPIIAII